MGTRVPTRIGMRPVLAVALAVLWSASAEAQANRDAECIQRYNEAGAGRAGFGAINPASSANGCRRVAVAVQADWETRNLFGTAVSPRDMAATRDQTTASPGETTAPIEPVEAAGGSVAAVGTDKGTGAVTAIAINPSIFFVDPADTEAVARWSRFTDVTLLVPMSDLEEGGGDGGDAADYVGVRWSLNINGLQRGSELHSAVVAAYNRFLASGTAQTQRVQGLLAALPAEDLASCLRVLVETASLDESSAGRITQTCGGAPIATDPAVITGLQEAIHAARVQADSRYLGLDLRADFGELSLAGVDTVSGTSLFAGVGWGRRFVRRAATTTGVRAHMGLRYWDPDEREENGVAVEGGLGFEAIRFYNFQRLTLSGGLDLRHRTDELAADERTNVNLRGSLNVPVTPTASVSLNLAAPVSGDLPGPVLTIKGNWRLLWSRWF